MCRELLRELNGISSEQICAGVMMIVKRFGDEIDTRIMISMTDYEWVSGFAAWRSAAASAER